MPSSEPPTEALIGSRRYRSEVTPRVSDLTDRLRIAGEGMASAGLGAIVVTPGSNLVYLSGYDAVPLERITALVIPATGEPFLLVPRLELLAATASPVGELGLEILTWDETDDPYRMIAARLSGVDRIGLANDMTADKVLRLRAAMPDIEQDLAGPVLDELRQRKSPAEITALREAAAAIDRVHQQVPDLLRVGRTEKEVGDDIARLIRAEGHDTVDFVIVASGPNSASPHHAVSGRRLEVGEPIVVDIGGTMPSGYCSDCTRTYVLGEASPEFQQAYDRLSQAQHAAVASVRPGVTAGSIDARAREGLGDLAEFFIHRTGHGIGLVTHEEPYIMAGSEVVIEPGMAFSVEPGFYVEGRWGARIEDIVVCTEEGVESLNTLPRELYVVPVGS
jgi:Xaa-Pro aminopeptidase